MTTPAPPLEVRRKWLLRIFPFLAHFQKASDRGLSLRTSVSRLHLEGDAGDPWALRAGVDTGGRLLFDPGVAGMLPPALYLSAPDGGNYVRVATTSPGYTAGGSAPALPAATPGTTIQLGPGSKKVTIA